MLEKPEDRVDKISHLLKTAGNNLKKAQQLLEILSREVGKNYEDVPGVLGIFDGEKMVAADGKTYKINPNYAAKSMLVAGDNLKMVEEEGKQIFKQITKVPRKRVEGVVNKKEGQWYVLTDLGSYKVLSVAAEFREAKTNDKAVILIPEDNTGSPFCALESITKEGEGKEEKVTELVEEKPKEAAKVKKAPEKKEEEKPLKKPSKEERELRKEKTREPKEEEKPSKKISELKEDDLR